MLLKVLVKREPLGAKSVESVPAHLVVQTLKANYLKKIVSENRRRFLFSCSLASLKIKVGMEITGGGIQKS